MYALSMLTGSDAGGFLLTIAVILVGAKILGEIAERFRQPAVLGELVAGVLLGPSLLNVVSPSDPTIFVLAEIGIIVLLFEIGLETDIGKLLKVGGASALVAIVGVALPFALGYAVMHALGFSTLESIVTGAALTATSVGITARVLSDLRRLDAPEGQIILGAAVIDDVIGLIILAIVTDLVAGQVLSVGGVAKTSVLAFGFIAVVLIVGRFTAPPLFNLLARLGGEQSLAIMSLALAFLLALVAEAAGSALIIGAFAAGLIVAPTKHAHACEEGVVRIGQFFVPIFFVSVGAAVDVRAFADTRVLLTGIALLVVAFVGKFAAGYAPFWFRGRKSVIGVGMVPRGEVGLIFAQAGLAAGVLEQGVFGSIMLMIFFTTFAAPPLLRTLLGGAPQPTGETSPEEDAGGVAEMTTEV